ncbi:MAG: hypothetical protein WCD80_11985 [Desulfobaccales bacterium]
MASLTQEPARQAAQKATGCVTTVFPTTLCSAEGLAVCNNEMLGGPQKINLSGTGFCTSLAGSGLRAGLIVGANPFGLAFWRFFI